MEEKFETDLEPTTAEPGEQIPEKTDRCLWWLMFLEGLVILGPWNAVLTALGFFNDAYNLDSKNPRADIYSNMPLANFFSNILFQSLASLIGQRVPFHIKFTLMNILMGAMFMTLPFTAHSWGGKSPFILYAEVFILGGFNAFLQASVFGLGGVLPFKYMTAIMGGNGVVGLLIGLIRMICLATFGDDPKGEWDGTLVYFIIALIIVLAGVVGFLILPNNPLLRRQLTNASVTTSSTRMTTLSIWMNINVEAIIVFMTFVVTFLVFPAVSIQENIPGLTNKAGWSWAIMATVFNLFDTLGRFLPIIFRGVSKERLYMVLLFRFIFVITFGLLYLYSSKTSKLYGFLLILNMAVFSFTNGFSSSLAMGYGPSNVTDENKSVAGNMMSFHLIFGIFVGTMGGKGISKMMGSFRKLE